MASPVHKDLRQAHAKLVERIEQSLGIKCKKVQIKVNERNVRG